MARFSALALAAALAFSAAPALAQEYKAGDITIDAPWSRATPKGAEVAAGYLVIHNRGAVADKLLGGTADFAGSVEVHEMSVDNGVVKMRQLASGLEIAPHGDIALSPKSYHLMFSGLKRQLKKGESIKADLTFERAGSVSVTFQVGGVGDTSPGGAAKPDDGMKGMKM